MRRLAAPALVAILALPAAAAEVRPCDDSYASRAEAIAEPWEDNTRTFASGAVRIALMDTVEPAAAPFHLMIVSPPYDELGIRQCRLVSFDGTMGYASMSLEGLETDYDPATGLRLGVPMRVYNPDTTMFDEGILEVVLDQATGEIAAEDFGS
ncbi:hypothetical protein EF888_05195 [Silicimonas algicola]|uniref:Uncharacterized protein n=1 Tax=Silicimonas algicola TaxID=1826607 RepID=A0A316GDA8_9RHOB|nr:hypothetical protein [Silicimonas algicola]AZQ66588.1 hypothetical protein EF888_05195 [Silicimonas algicola]PWK58931.1 hypothetical protein C8D95_101751 [Silicimonas algicola]